MPRAPPARLVAADVQPVPVTVDVVLVKIAPRAGAPRGWALDVVVISAATYLVGRLAGLFTGYLKGYDAVGQLSKARLVFQYFPHINWNPAWYAGSPMFQGTYPPGYHLIIAATTWASGLSLAGSMQLWGAAAIAAQVLGCYGLVLAVASRRAAAMVAAGLVLATPVLWCQELVWGLYPRTLGFGFAALGIATAALDRRRASRPRAVATTLLLGLALWCHPVPGLIGVALTAGVLLISSSPPLRTRLAHAGWICAGAVGLSASFYLPLLLVPRAQSAFTDNARPLRWYELFLPLKGDISTLPPAMVALALGVVAAAAWTLLRPRQRLWHQQAPREDVRATADVQGLAAVDAPAVPKTDRPSDNLWHLHAADLGLVAFFVIATLVSLTYGLVGYVKPHFGLYVNGMEPEELLTYSAWLLAAVIGIGGTVVLAGHGGRARLALSAIGFGAVAGCLSVTLSAVLSPAVRGSDPMPQALVKLLPKAAYNNFNYRLFGEDDLTSRWLNAVTTTAQVRGYEEQAALHLNLQYWVEDTVSGSYGQSSPAARAYLLDYYAVRWLFTDNPIAAKLASLTPGLHQTGSEPTYGDVAVWQDTASPPLATAVSCPTVLVVADTAHYELVLRALSFADVGASQLLPVRAGPDLDGLSAADLAGYKTVLIYGATVGNPARDNSVLASYVRGGGHLVVDSGDDPALVTELNAARGSVLPVSSTTTLPVYAKWAFRSRGSSLLAGADLRAWSPPVYGNDQALAVQVGKVAAGWAAPLLYTNGQPVIVSGKLGKGNVLWSGLNLPYILDTSSNRAESSFLGRALGDAQGPPRAPRVSDLYVNAEQRDLVLPAHTGAVFLRQYTTTDWHATVDGKAVPILTAGPDMTLVQVPKADQGHPARVVLRYSLDKVGLAGYALSAISLVSLAAYALGLTGLFAKGAHRALDRLR